jgi:hypothetical protein
MLITVITKELSSYPQPHRLSEPPRNPLDNVLDIEKGTDQNHNLINRRQTAILPRNRAKLADRVFRENIHN